MADSIIIRIPRRAASVALAALVVTSVVIVAVWADRGPGAAEARAERYVAALVSADARTAWGQLTDRVRTIWGSFDSFEAAVRGADWSRFDYEVVQTHCDDLICAVDISIPNGVDSVPTMLYEGPTHYWWGTSKSLIFNDQFVTGGDDEARRLGVKRARIVVIDGVLPWDDHGIG